MNRLKNFTKKSLQMHNFLLIHGPNLNLLGRRDAHHYGTLTQKKLEAMMRVEAAKFQIKII